jgi:hypothetical protein
MDGIVPGRYRLFLGDEGVGIVPVWYPGSYDRADTVPVSLGSGMNELEPVVLRAAGKLALTLPGWSDPEPPRIEYRETLPPDSSPEAEPFPWKAFPADRGDLVEGVTFPSPACPRAPGSCVPARLRYAETFWRF